jgi:hypothetical protein
VSSNLIKNQEIEELMEILEQMSDEEKSTQLLKRFGKLSSEWGRLMLNQDRNLKHEEWKRQCDLAKKQLEEVIKEIKAQK